MPSIIDQIVSGTATAITTNAAIIGTYAFANNSNLTSLTLPSETLVPLANTNAFTGTPFASGNAGGTLYVPSSLIASYQAATNWSTILGYSTNQIQAIS